MMRSCAVVRSGTSDLSVTFSAKSTDWPHTQKLCHTYTSFEGISDLKMSQSFLVRRLESCLNEGDMIELLLSCCGSKRWASLMVKARPFANDDDLLKTSDQIWATQCNPSDYLEAFSKHPPIGSRPTTTSSAEQATIQATETSSSRQQLEKLNREYFEKFGFVFLICATGKTAEDVLAALQKRLNRSYDDEVKQAALEQGEITKLRMLKWKETALSSSSARL